MATSEMMRAELIPKIVHLFMTHPIHHVQVSLKVQCISLNAFSAIYPLLLMIGCLSILPKIYSEMKSNSCCTKSTYCITSRIACLYKPPCPTCTLYVHMYIHAAPPSAPGGLTLDVQQRSITVVWSSPASTGGRSDLYYQVEHSDPDNLGTYTGTVSLSGGSISHSFTDLRPYTQYCVRVIAHNGVSDQDPDGTNLRTVEECTRTLESGKSSSNNLHSFCNLWIAILAILLVPLSV